MISNEWRKEEKPVAKLCRIGGSVVEFSPATRETGVRFPANAFTVGARNEIGEFLQLEADS